MNKNFMVDCKLFHLRIHAHGVRFWVGVLLALFCGLLCICVGASAAATVVLSALFLILATLNLESKERVTKWLNILWFACAPFVILFSMQLLLNESTFSLGLLRIALGMACIGIVLILLLLISRNYRTAVLSTTTAFMIFTAVNYFVYIFRGSELAPADFLSVGTAMAVVEQYQFSINTSFAYACILAVAYCFLGFCMEEHKFLADVKAVFCGLVMESALFFLVVCGSHDIAPLHFLQTGSVQNGYILNFVLQIQESIVKKPDGYSLDSISDIENRYVGPENQTSAAPDIIVIMNESFADLRVLGSELQTNIPVTPYFDSLTTNTVRGYAYSSILGGGTPNSEYEFLSGNTMGFLPTGSIVYQQFIQQHSYTLLSYLNALDYNCIATHPCPGTNWTRDSVYPRLGFDEMIFVEDYPQDHLIRSYVSDQEMYEQVISWYENRDPSSPFFLFGITMQNHGAYTHSGVNFTADVHLEGYSRNYPDVEQYLTLIRQSDLALKYLINYFENVEHDVVILFFGDHFPKLDSRFYEEVHGGTFNTLDEQMLQYTVPFFIWANYDIDEKNIELTSLNFLSNHLMETAGLELPAYNQFLADVNEVIPAMNSFGYYSKEQGRFISYEEASDQEAEILQMYQWLQHNCLFDAENTSSFFFPISTAE